LSQSGEGDTTVQSTETLLLHDGVECVGGVTVLWHVEWVGHRVVLRLKTDLDNLHWGDDGDGFCDTCGETSCELLAVDFAFMNLANCG
jgi:hypothetical protein